MGGARDGSARDRERAGRNAGGDAGSDACPDGSADGSADGYTNSSLPGVILQVRTTAQVTGVRVVSSDGSRTWEAERRQVNQAGSGQKFGYIWIVMDSGLPQAGTYVVEYQLGDSQMTEKFTWDGK